MKLKIILIFVLLGAVGCATSQKQIEPVELRKKTEEIEVLVSEIPLLILNLERLQKHLATLPESSQFVKNGVLRYSSADHVHELDRTIEVLRDATRGLSEQQAGLVKKYKLGMFWGGPY